MTRLTRWAVAAAVAAVSSSAARAQALAMAEPWMQQQEAVVSVQGHIPGLGDLEIYEWGYGLSLDYRYWFHDLYGVGVSLGLENWAVDEGYDKDWAGWVEGDLGVYPLGVSAYLRAVQFAEASITLRGGFSYAFVSSDISLATESGEFDVDVDDSFLLTLGADLDVRMADQIWFVGGVGYQYDLSGGDAAIRIDNLKDNSLEAFSIRLGLKFAF